MNLVKKVATELLKESETARRASADKKLSSLLEYLERNPDPNPVVIFKKMQSMNQDD